MFLHEGISDFHREHLPPRGLDDSEAKFRTQALRLEGGTRPARGGGPSGTADRWLE